MGGNLSGYPASYTWAHTPRASTTSPRARNGTCSPTCGAHAGTGWDGPTGLGTPNGTGAF